MVKLLDLGLEKTSKRIIQLSVDQGEDSREQTIAVRSLEHKVDKLEREVGNKPLALPADVNAPTVWGAIGALGAKLDGVAAKYIPPSTSRVPEEVEHAIQPFKRLMYDTMADRAVALEERINKVKSFVVKSTKQINERIETEVADADWRDKSSPSPRPDPELEKVMKSFEAKLDKVSDRLAQVTAETDEHAIRF